MKFTVEEVELEQMPQKAVSESYQELYEMFDNMTPDGKPVRIGPMTSKEANSAQTSITSHCNKSALTMVYTRKADRNGKPIPKGNEEAICWLYVRKITRPVEEKKEQEEE